MKKILLFLFAIAILASCKAFDPKLLNPTGQAFNPKLPALEHSVENTMIAVVDKHGEMIGANPQDVKTYFDREVDEIFTNPYGVKKGSIILKVTDIETGFAGLGFVAPTLLTASIANLFGMPINGAKSSVEVEISVLNSQNTLLGKYRGTGYEKFYGSWYNGKLYSEPVRIANLLAIKKAIEDAKTKMLPDLNRLNTELNK